jgi:polyisoprenoid-binding protein YceI
VGYAKGISGIINFDPNNPIATTGKIAVDVSSVQFANEGYTATAQNYALNKTKYPQITLTLRKVVSGTRPNAHEYRGIVLADLFCHGVTTPMRIPISATFWPARAEERTGGKYKGDLLVIRTKFSISRTRQGISAGIPSEMVGDSVEVGVGVVGIHYATTSVASPSPGPNLPNANPVKKTDLAKLDQPAVLDFRLASLSRKAGTVPELPSLAKGKFMVLFCLSEQCGVTYHYRQRIQQIQRDFEPLGFRFVGIRCGKRENPGKPLDLAESHYLKMPFFDDFTGELTRYFGVKQSVTFEVLDPNGRLRYQGGFDDNVEASGVRRSFLRNALRDLVAGRPVRLKEGAAIGCAIIPIDANSHP